MDFSHECFNLFVISAFKDFLQLLGAVCPFEEQVDFFMDGVVYIDHDGDYYVEDYKDDDDPEA